MKPPLANPKDSKIPFAKTFALQFDNLEWGYLCSYQWFLTGMDRALETGDFTSLQARAENMLVDDHIRLHGIAKRDSKHLAARLG
jgi:hypothetical protein